MFRLLLAVPALLLALALAVHTQAATPTTGQSSAKVPQHWEYITLFKPDGQHWFLHVLKTTGTVETALTSPNSRQDAGEQELAKLGVQGWELVGAIGTPDASSEVLYLKRPLP